MVLNGGNKEVCFRRWLFVELIFCFGNFVFWLLLELGLRFEEFDCRLVRDYRMGMMGVLVIGIGNC